MQKVNFDVMKRYAYPQDLSLECQLQSLLTSSLRWIATKISEILGMEDDVVVGLCHESLESSRYVCHLPP